MKKRLDIKLILTFLFSLLSFSGFAKSITLYLDPASLPGLNQLMHFTQQSDDKEQVRVIGLSRFRISPEIVAQYKNTHIVEIQDGKLDENIAEIFDKYEGVLELDLHVNLNHVFELMHPIIAYRFKYPDRISINSLTFYDDGSSDYVELEELESVDVAKQIKYAERQLTHFLITGQAKFSNPTIARYVWQSVFPVKYHFLRPDYFDKAPFLHPLKDYLAGHYQKMDWSAYQKLTWEKQAFYLKLVGFNEEIKQLLDMPQVKFIFTGTTTWEGNTDVREYYAQQQLNLLNHFIREDGDLFIGDQYKIYFKGHPRGADLNDYILNHVKGITNIPAHISFEILMMTGQLPDKVGGVASSLYFSLPKEHIDHIIFTANKQVKSKEDALNNPYVRVMRRLGIVEESQVLFWDSFRQL